MKTRQILATGLIAALVGATAPVNLMAGGQQNATISGTAKSEAKKPYTNYTTRARNVQGGQIAGTVTLDTNGNFSLPGLPPANYVVELLNHDGKVVCTEGPFNMTQQPVKDDVKISCNNKKVPTAYWLLGAAAAAGVTAGVASGGSDAGPASTSGVSQQSSPASPAQ
jgi:hypothetical protein